MKALTALVTFREYATFRGGKRLSFESHHLLGHIMKKHYLLTLILGSLLALGGCAQNLTGETYSRDRNVLRMLSGYT